MEHAAKVDHFLAEMKARGVDESTAAPPAFRKWWKAGKEIPPPLFLEFGKLARFSGFYWGVRMFLVLVVVSLAVGLLFRAPLDKLLAIVAINAVAWTIGGFAFGVILAAWFRHKAKKLGLPAWEDYPPPEVGS